MIREESIKSAKNYRISRRNHNVIVMDSRRFHPFWTGKTLFYELTPLTMETFFWESMGIRKNALNCFFIYVSSQNVNSRLHSACRPVTHLGGWAHRSALYRGRGHGVVFDWKRCTRAPCLTVGPPNAQNMREMPTIQRMFSNFCAAKMITF